MLNILLGIILTTGFFGLYTLSKNRKLILHWWQWLLTIIWLCYTGFAIKLIEGFLSEGAAKAALVMGIIFGFLAVLAGVVLFRFVFLKPQSHD